MCVFLWNKTQSPQTMVFLGLATNRINTKVRIRSDACRNMISRPLQNAPLKRAAQIVRMHLSPCRCVSMSRLRAHTQARSYRYTPKSLRWLQLGATIKTVVAFFFSLFFQPFSKGYNLIGADTSNPAATSFFIKGAETSAQLLSLRAPAVPAWSPSLCVRGGPTTGW